MCLCYFLAVKIYCVMLLSYSDMKAFAYHCFSPVVCRPEPVQFGKLAKFLKSFQEAAKPTLETIKCDNWACYWRSSFMNDSVPLSPGFIFVSFLSLLILVVILSLVLLVCCLLAKHKKPKECERVGRS